MWAITDTFWYDFILFQSCSYFTSNAVPLKLVFKNSKIQADPVYSMFKVNLLLPYSILIQSFLHLLYWSRRDIYMYYFEISSVLELSKRNSADSYYEQTKYLLWVIKVLYNEVQVYLNFKWTNSGICYYL